MLLIVYGKLLLLNCKMIKTRAGSLRMPLVYLAYRNIRKKWIMPLANWATMLQQLAIKFGDRFKLF